MAQFDVFVFDQPFQEAVAWFLAKGIMTKAEFDRLSAAEQARAFTAARVYAADELQRIFDAIGKALESGTTVREFMAATEDIFASAWHAETVFRTNVLSAYGAGHWQQANQVKDLRPYARYSAVMDGRTRPQHAALHGLVYPLDHPFWRTYWPPWDYNCRCMALTMSPGEVAKEGLQVQQSMQDLPPRPKNFQSPAQGGKWQPDYSKYEPELGRQLKKEVTTFDASLRQWLKEIVAFKRGEGPEPENRMFIGTFDRMERI